MISYGKLVILTMEENGKHIGEKLFFVLNPKQRKELIQFIREFDEESKECKITVCDSVLCNSSDILKEVTESFTEIEIGDLYFCLEQRKVYVCNIEIRLTAKEFDLFALLIMHPKRVFTYEMIIDLVWHEDYMFYSRKAVNNHVSNLRKKLKITPDIPDYVKSVYGVGYKFEV